MIDLEYAHHADIASLFPAVATGLLAFAAFLSTLTALFAVRTQARDAAAQINAATEAAKMQSRASVVSASRQRWIDALRDDIAEFLTVDSQVKRFDPMPSRDPAVNLSSIRERNRLLARRNQALARIRLRLNPKEEEHEALYEKLSELPSTCRLESRPVADDVVAKTQVLLKGEWDRVKREASGDVALSTPSIS